MRPSRLAAFGAIASAKAARDARHAAANILARWGLGDEVAFRAEVIISELLANAVQHAPPPRGEEIDLHLAYGIGGLLVEVEDGGGERVPVVRDEQDGDCERGRGLALVQHFATWGYRTLPDGRRSTWAHLPETQQGEGS
ncbi:ATP-binding protein [Streptomyces sp. NPDC049555]|uniref:ATP-binding protein n=1 Tax=Streptomyces sp. NPDC049555 TaxID=3154930 RepID=UPI00343ED898